MATQTQIIEKAPPHDYELEEVVLGAIMLEEDAEYEVMDTIRPETFYKHENQEIYKAILDLKKANSKIDIYTVTEQLSKNGVLEKIGGAYYVASLTEKVGSSAHLAFHARILEQKAIKRTLINWNNMLQIKLFDDTADLQDIIDESYKMIDYATDGIVKGSANSIMEILPSVMKEIEEASNTKNGISGVPTGFPSLDDVTQGWQKTDLIIIAARPSMGKTALVVSMLINIAQQGIPCCLFSCEMSKNAIAKRMLSMQSGLNSKLLRSGKMTDDEWNRLESTIQRCDLPIYIDDESSMSIRSFKTKAKKYVTKYGCKLIAVDYLQLMCGKNTNNREQEVASISHALKDVAKELDIPVIALSQLSRAVEVRQGDKRPTLSDLRDSGAIEQDADIVCFVHRPEYYGIEVTEDGISTEGLGQIIVAKQRNGATCDVNLHYTKELAKFDEWSDAPITTTDF